MSIVKSLFDNERLKHDLSDIQLKYDNDIEVSDSEADRLTTYFFICLTYKNWQRAGAVLNMTLDEAQAAVVKDNKLV